MSTENLYTKEAKDKIQEIAITTDFAMMITDPTSKPFHAIPMSTKNVDDHGAIWFLSKKNSLHNQHIQNDADLHLIYNNPGNMSFLKIYGRATIHTDRVLLEEFYQSTDDSWFDGVDDPNLCAIRVEPLDAHYWEPKSGKIISLLKMGVGAVTGKKVDVGREGNLEVKR